MKPPGAFSRFEQALRREAEDVEMIEGRAPGVHMVKQWDGSERPARKPGRPPSPDKRPTQATTHSATQIALPHDMKDQLRVVAECMNIAPSNLLRAIAAAGLEAVVNHMDANDGEIRLPLSLMVCPAPLVSRGPMRRLTDDQFARLKTLRSNL